MGMFLKFFMYVFLLSKENIELSKEEVISLIPSKYLKLIDNLLIIAPLTSKSIRLVKRLAYTKALYELLFYCKRTELIKQIKNFDWNSIYYKDFCLRTHGKFNESELASLIWKQLKNPKVNLENPNTKIEIFSKDKIYCCRELWVNKEKFNEREPTKRPAQHPTTLKPKLARCLVNLTGAKTGTIVDPFCGSGAILLEAGLMGFKVVGYDIDKNMLEKTKTNLQHYKIKSFRLIEKDATTIKRKFKYIVTDLPYGRSSKLTTNIKILYTKFVKRLKTILIQKAVICFPNSVNYHKIIKESNLNIFKKFDYYIHKSLSKRIIIVTK